MQRLGFRPALETLASVAMIVAAGAVLWTLLGSRPSPPISNRDNTPVPVEPLPLLDSATLGEPSAPVVIMGFSDFECPYCARFAVDTLPLLTTEYLSPGIAQFVFRHMPLSKHRYADRAAQAAECARQEGKFWQLHDRLFTYQDNLSDSWLKKYAVLAGLDASEFDSCLDGSNRDRIQADLDLAAKLRVKSTPTFLIGILNADHKVQVDTVLVGALSIEAFREAIAPLVERGRQTLLSGR